MGFIPGGETSILILLVLDYIAFATIFFTRYLNPKQWALWLVESASNYFMIYLLSIFLVGMPVIILFQNSDTLQLSSLGIFLLMYAFIVIVALALIFKMHKNSLLPGILFIFGIAFEVQYSLSSPQGIGFALLIIWYFLGIGVILVAGQIVGTFLKQKFPEVEKEHLALAGHLWQQAKKEEKALQSKTSSPKFPAESAGMGIAYALWMLLRFIIFGF